MNSGYLTIIIRNALREKTYTVINILGLALSIGACLILASYLYTELSYDQHNVLHERVYRVTSQVENQGSVERFAESSFALGPLLKRDYPEIQEYVRFRALPTSPTVFRYGDTVHYQDDVFFADEKVFEVFTHSIMEGDPVTALSSPDAIAISHSFARTFFGNEDPIGKIVTTDLDSFRVSLVFEDLPENSHLQYDVLLSYHRLSTGVVDSSRIGDALWDLGAYTYLLLPDGYNSDNFSSIYDDFWARYMAEKGRELSSTMRLQLEPLASVHFFSDTSGSSSGVHRLYVYLLIAIGLFALFVSVINYINLAIARALKRSREIGVRKTLGAEKSTLIAQFVGESLFFAFCGVIAGWIIAQVLLEITPISTLLGKEISLITTISINSVATVFLATMILGIVAGSYPAFYLSSLAPATSLRDSAGKQGRQSVWLRQFLVIVQLTISIGVIACSLLMFNQMQFIHTQDLGFIKDNRVVVPLRGADAIERLPEIESRLGVNGNISGTALSRSIPGQMDDLYLVEVESSSGVLQTAPFRMLSFDSAYIDVMGLQILHGRGFSDSYQSASVLPVLVNETAVREMGWSEPIGKRLRLRNNDYSVIGVVRDFNFHDLGRQIEPLLMFQDNADFGRSPPSDRALQYRYLTVAVDGNVADVVDSLRQIMEDIDPVHPYEFWHLSDYLDSLYESQARQMKLMGVFAALCVFISCMGLLGLSSLMTQRRTKEIGIRKVLGASTSQIILLLVRGILIALSVAAVVASILAYLTFVRWQQGFYIDYRVSIDVVIFVIAVGICATVALLTIAGQSYQTANRNPVDSLRYE